MKKFLKANEICGKSSFHAYIRFARLCRELDWEFVCSWGVTWKWINGHLSVLENALNEVLVATKLGEFEDEREDILQRWRRRQAKDDQYVEEEANDEDDLLDF